METGVFTCKPQFPDEPETTPEVFCDTIQRMRRRSLCSLLAAMLVLVARPVGFEQSTAPARSPRNASYQLVATLDPDDHTISGSGRIIWRNITKAPARDLRFHLYWNAWRDTNSSWMREQALASRGSQVSRPADDWGSIDLLSIVAGGQDLRAGASFVAPDDGNKEDRTVLAVPLASPVQPGETIDIDITWTAKVPRTFARTGRIGQYYFIAQWFPKLGVFRIPVSGMHTSSTRPPNSSPTSAPTT